jgi:hypothetical protein
MAKGKHRPSRGPTVHHSTPDLAPRWRDAGLAAACALVALWLYRRARDGFFTVDDFIYLERAAGIVPAHETAWRFVSGRLYPWLALHVFGRDPAPYLTAQWLSHGLTAAMLYFWLRRRSTPLMAALGAGLWAGSAQFVTVVYQMTTFGETAALGLSLFAFVLAESGGRGRLALATVVFVIALACKESVVLLPLLLVLPDGSAASFRARLLRATPLLVAGAAWIAYVAATESQARIFGGSAYASGVGLHVATNLLRYAAWSLDVVHPTPDLQSGFSPVAGIALAVLLAAAIVLARRGRHLALAGMCGWLLALAPVLFLLHARYQHYLYAPLAFLAAAVAGLFAPRNGVGAAAPRWAWAAVTLVVIGQAAWSDRLLQTRHTTMLPGLDLPFDPFLRKTEFSRRFALGLGALPKARSRLLVLEPEGVDRVYNVRTGREARGLDPKLGYRVIEATLDDGRALRFLYPQLDTVAFADRWEPVHDDFVLVTHAMSGAATVHGRGPDAHASVARQWMRAGFAAASVAHLTRVLRVHPGAAKLRYLRAAGLAMLGRDADARPELERVAREAPEPEASMAREALRQESGHGEVSPGRSAPSAR